MSHRHSKNLASPTINPPSGRSWPKVPDAESDSGFPVDALRGSGAVL